MTLDEVIETIEVWRAESGYGPEAAMLAADVLGMLQEVQGPDEFLRGFDEGARRAESEAWEVLRDALAPDPLRGESDPILTLPDGVTLAAAVGHVAAALADMKRSGSKP